MQISLFCVLSKMDWLSKHQAIVDCDKKIVLLKCSDLLEVTVTPLLRSDQIGESEPDPGCSLNCDAPSWGSVIS